MKSLFRIIHAAGGLTAALIAGSSFALSPSDLRGEPARDMVVERTINVTGDSRWVNVKYGEVVRIQRDGQAFAWDFDGLAPSVQLSEIAPQGFNAANIVVYVNQSENPLSNSTAGGE
jgi:hypothetical protein